jgi:hypothetical protein
MTLRNITLSAEQSLIEQARQRARKNNTTLNAEFRRWLMRYVDSLQTTDDISDLMNRLGYASPGQKFTRDEMNER